MFAKYNTIQWVFDTYVLANFTGRAVTKSGGDSWFFVTTNFAFGASLEAEATKIILANGGKVIAAVRHPLNTADFLSFLLTAQTSGAKVIGLANAGGDTINALKQAAEFGIESSGKQHIAALLIFINDVHALGLKTAQGLLLTTAFYWNLDDATHTWSKRFFDRNGNKMPNMKHAGVYSTIRAYLETVAASFTSYPIAHGFGAVALISPIIRYRIYAPHGLGVGHVANICLLTGLTFWLGNLTAFALSLLFDPTRLAPSIDCPLFCISLERPRSLSRCLALSPGVGVLADSSRSGNCLSGFHQVQRCWFRSQSVSSISALRLWRCMS